MKGIEGQVAIVTGAAQGIGRAISLRLAEAGANVALLDLKEPTAVLDEIARQGGRGTGFIVDVASPESVQSAIDAVNDQLGAPTILVNNAGLHANPMVNFVDMTLDTWRRMMSVDLDSMFHMCKAVVPGMIEAGRGRIINMSSASVNALTPPGMMHYITAKAGVIGFTRGLATDIGDHGITVNALAPTGVRTEGVLEIGASKELMQVLANSQAIKRVMEPEDVAGAVAFLASDEASMITAQVLFTDGGAVRPG